MEALFIYNMNLILYFFYKLSKVFFSNYGNIVIGTYSSRY